MASKNTRRRQRPSGLYEPRPRDTRPQKCERCPKVLKGPAGLAGHEIRMHGIHHHQGKRIIPVGPGAWQVEGRKTVYASLQAARAAVGPRPDGSIHTASAGLPGLGKRR